MTRYFEWNYDTHEAIEYARRGECSGCGACCRALVRYTTSAPVQNSELGTGVKEEGIWIEVEQNGNRRFMQNLEIRPDEHVCLSQEGNMCKLHAMKSSEVPLCDVWPLSPSHVAPFKECSYSFEEIGRWRFE